MNIDAKYTNCLNRPIHEKDHTPRDLSKGCKVLQEIPKPNRVISIN